MLIEVGFVDEGWYRKNFQKDFDTLRFEMADCGGETKNPETNLPFNRFGKLVFWRDYFSGFWAISFKAFSKSSSSLPKAAQFP
jgi:hypothetical protein